MTNRSKGLLSTTVQSGSAKAAPLKTRKSFIKSDLQYAMIGMFSSLRPCDRTAKLVM